jgi:hypothetical protein
MVTKAAIVAKSVYLEPGAGRPLKIRPHVFRFADAALGAILKIMHSAKMSFVIGFCVCGLVGCAEDSATTKKPTAAVVPAPMPPAKKIPVGKNVFLEIQGDQRRVLVAAYVCLRQGQLEQFLTRKRTKEHEAILAADVDARDIHAALNLAGAKEGKPVQFRPKYQPASGSIIKISLDYTDKGKKIVVPARSWVRDSRSGKELDQDWVFAGSELIPDPMDNAKKPFYAANDGDVICVSNFDTAMLDLPIESSKDSGDLAYEAYTERIPPLDTAVLVILEPVAKKQ